MGEFRGVHSFSISGWVGLAPVLLNGMVDASAACPCVGRIKDRQE